jgi:hypothetical protein
MSTSSLALALALALCASLSGCASVDTYRVEDEDLTVQWCPETGETTLHFDFGDASDDATEPRLWRGGYHVSVTSVRAAMFAGGRSAMGRGVSHAAFKSGQAITEEDLAPMTPGRAWRLTVRGEMQERPEQARVHLRGGPGPVESAEASSHTARFVIVERPDQEVSGCLDLSARLMESPER